MNRHNLRGGRFGEGEREGGRGPHDAFARVGGQVREGPASTLEAARPSRRSSSHPCFMVLIQQGGARDGESHAS